MVTYIIGSLEARERFQCREAQTGSGSKLPSLVYDVLHTPGQPLDPAVRTFFEYHFRCDFSQVRVHTDACAMASAYVMNTLAYAVGNHVVFGGGQYAPWTPEGKKLLAHELTHVVQQSQTAPLPLEYVPFNESGDAFEQEADECAHIITAHATDPYQELHVMRKTNGPVFQGWWVDQHARAHPEVRGQTHEHITRTVLNEPEFARWFHQRCKDFLIRGSAEPDIEKPDLERLLGRELTAAAYHGWGASEATIDGFIASFVRTAADYLNHSTRGLDYCLREVLGKALHAAQDKGAHLSPCRIGGRECRPDEQDNPSINVMGWRRAFENTRRVLRNFYTLLNNNSRHWLQTGPKR